MAIIVNETNSATDMTLAELKSILLLEKQFWPSGKRIALFLPPENTTEAEILLQQIYKQTEPELNKYWVGRLFQGKIPAIPATVKTRAVAAAAVRKSAEAVSVVIASEIPPRVRVVRVDGKLPADANYPLKSIIK